MKENKRKKKDVPLCDMCGEKMNPTINIYRENICMCKYCFSSVGNVDGIIGKSLERFLLGNVV